jgi:long-subunit fatty acid transport protein
VTQSARTDNRIVLPSITNGDRNTIRGSLQAAYQLTPTVSFGPSFSASQSSGTSATEIDAISPGAFLKMQLTRLTSFQLEAGVNFFSTRYPDVGVIFLNQPHLPTSDYYISAVLRNQVTRFINLTASVLHDLDYADGLTATERTLVSVGANYHLNKRVWINLAGYYEDGTVLSPLNGGDYSRFSFSAGMTYRLGPKLSTALQYRYTHRSANNGDFAFVSNGHLFTEAASSGNYNQNEISLSVNYAF